MRAIGKGVEEIRVAEPSGAYRVIYVARRPESVYVLHAFQKKHRQRQRRSWKLPDTDLACCREA